MASMDVPAGRPVAAPTARARVAVVKPTYITWLTLAFMTTASVASLRSAPTMAVYGLTCLFLYVVPAIVFLLIVNGASFVGQRPVIGPPEILQGGLLILQTYCPDKVPSFRDKFDELKTDDTVKG